VKSSITIRLLPALLVAMLIHAAYADFSFVPGDYYTSNYFSLVITQYDSSGTVVGSFTLPSNLGTEVRGLAFGSDNLLYATVVRGSGFAVLALNSSGAVQQTYPGSVYVAGNLSYGKIALDNQYIYVAGQDLLTRFTLGQPNSGMAIYTNNQVFDVKPLPNGHLLVASAYEIDEITNSGTFIRSIPLVGDDNSYTDIRGIEYDPPTNKLFVTELGHTNFFFQIMRIDASTGVLERNVTFNYADDLFLDASGRLLVGSRTQTPNFYTQNLDQVGMLGDGQQMFVTQYPVPALVLTSAVSRKTHGAAGTFDIPLPLTGNPGVECRTGGTTNDYTQVFTFTNNVVSGNASVTSGIGSVSGMPTFSGNTMTVNLTGVANVQTLTVTLSGVTDQFSQVLPDTPVSVNMLIGDTNGNGIVNATDIAQTKGQAGQPVNSGNFRTDVNASGIINATDVAIVKAHSGEGISAPLARASVARFKKKLAPPHEFSEAAFRKIDHEIWDLRVAVLGPERAAQRSPEDGKRSPVETY
jgi:hypothetical protein